MEETNFVFDVARPIALNLRNREGVKTVRVRFPTDEEWTERQRRRKVIVKHLGRGVSENNVPHNEEIDAALVARIRQEEEPAINAFEALRILEQLSEAEIDDVIPVNEGFRVTTRVLGGTTVHVIAMPSAEDVVSHRRTFARVLDLPFGRQEVTINLRAAGDLYKKLLIATEGYAGEAPIVHRVAAIKAVLEALDTMFQEDRDANFPPGSGPSSPPSAF